ncbi:MAG: flagellar export protein FliJ [Pseudomonadota bacterium]
MADRSERIQPVARLADNRESRAAKELAEAQQRLEQQHQQLTNLHGYKQEYEQALQTAGRQGLRGQQVRDFHRFLIQVDQAIAGQKQVVERAEAEVEQARRNWLAARTETRRIETLQSWYAEEEVQREQRQEQKETDERAGRPRGGPAR